MWRQPPSCCPAWAKPCGFSTSVRQQDSQVAQIVSGWTDLDSVSERSEKRIGVELIQSCCWIEPCLARTRQSCPICDCSRCGAISVHSVSPGTENSDVLVGNPFCTRQCELLISSTNSTVHDLHRDLASRNQAHGRELLPQFSHSIQQKISSFRVAPIVTGVVDVQDKGRTFGRTARCFDRAVVRKNSPPSGLVKHRIIRLRCFLDCTRLEKLPCRWRKLLQQVILLHDPMTVFGAGRIRHSRTGSQRVGRAIRNIRD